MSYQNQIERILELAGVDEEKRERAIRGIIQAGKDYLIPSGVFWGSPEHFRGFESCRDEVLERLEGEEIPTRFDMPKSKFKRWILGCLKNFGIVHIAPARWLSLRESSRGHK